MHSLPEAPCTSESSSFADRIQGVRIGVFNYSNWGSSVDKPTGSIARQSRGRRHSNRWAWTRQAYSPGPKRTIGRYGRRNFGTTGLMSTFAHTSSDARSPSPASSRKSKTGFARAGFHGWRLTLINSTPASRGGTLKRARMRIGLEFLGAYVSGCVSPGK